MALASVVLRQLPVSRLMIWPCSLIPEDSCCACSPHSIRNLHGGATLAHQLRIAMRSFFCLSCSQRGNMKPPCLDFKKAMIVDFDMAQDVCRHRPLAKGLKSILTCQSMVSLSRQTCSNPHTLAMSPCCAAMCRGVEPAGRLPAFDMIGPLLRTHVEAPACMSARAHA